MWRKDVKVGERDVVLKIKLLLHVQCMCMYMYVFVVCFFNLCNTMQRIHELALG